MASWTSSPPSLELLKDVIFFQGEGGSFARMSSLVKEVNGSIASLKSLTHAASWHSLLVWVAELSAPKIVGLW